MTYQIKGLGKLVNVLALKIRISGFRIRKSGKVPILGRSLGQPGPNGTPFVGVGALGVEILGSLSVM